MSVHTGLFLRETVGSQADDKSDQSQFFFFSSRRRHTRLQGDWSSDVCSSDLVAPPRVPGISRLSSKPQGLKIPPGRIEPKVSRQYCRDSGVTVVMSSRVTEVLTSGGGLMGKG